MTEEPKEQPREQKNPKPSKKSDIWFRRLMYGLFYLFVVLGILNLVGMFMLERGK
jgi:hypothetical protein